MFTQVLSGEVRGKLVQGDCLQIMPHIPNKSIDMILCDLPYGTTACKWDTIIPFEPLWEQYKRIIKDHGAIVLTASQPFTTLLVASNMEMFRYCWVWKKQQGTNPMLAKRQPLKIHEDICVFYARQCRYNPQMTMGSPYKGFESEISTTGETMGRSRSTHRENKKGDRYPVTIQEFNTERARGGHPTQKPVKLFEYLIKTYTNENDIVLDNCIGSGTTAVAAENLDRRWIGIELDPEYVRLANERIDRNRMERANRLF